MCKLELYTALQGILSWNLSVANEKTVSHFWQHADMGKASAAIEALLFNFVSCARLMTGNIDSNVGNDLSELWHWFG